MFEFRFNRLAYEGENFVGFAGSCDFCERPNPLIYQGGIYVPQPEPSVCDVCIAAGRLGERYSRNYPLFGDFQMDEADPELKDEVFVRTPGFATFNPFNWPVIDRKPLAFFGYGDRNEIWGDADARAAMEKAWLEATGEALTGPSAYLLAFREVDGARWAAEVDFD